MRSRTAIFSVLLMMASCTTDQYEAGDGRYSYLRADFVRAHTMASGEFDYVVTDDGDSLRLDPHAKGPWATKADSVYRALFYYNKVEQGATPVVMAQIPVVNPIQTTCPDTLHTDPMIFESAWVSKSSHYLNIGYAVKTGREDNADSRYQTVGIRYDSTSVDPQGVRRIFLTMLHHQNGVPEYYSNRGYLSVPLDKKMRPSLMVLTVNTYGGVLRREIRYD